MGASRASGWHLQPPGGPYSLLVASRERERAENFRVCNWMHLELISEESLAVPLEAFTKIDMASGSHIENPKLLEMAYFCM